MREFEVTAPRECWLYLHDIGGGDEVRVPCKDLADGDAVQAALPRRTSGGGGNIPLG